MFKDECNQAVRSLQDAELRKPWQYALLQNIGMIYLSRRFDPAADDLEHAERYYARSIETQAGRLFWTWSTGLGWPQACSEGPGSDDPERGVEDCRGPCRQGPPASPREPDRAVGSLIFANSLSERSQRRWLDRAVAYWRGRGFPYPELSQHRLKPM